MSSKNNYNPYQRQEELKGWNQHVVKVLKYLVLGTGGLGSTISMDLCRLGVSEIVLVDMDVVEGHNLNRQILYRREHVGKSKVECAKEELERHHINGNQTEKTTITTYHIDALKEWQTTVRLIKEADVIFNTIDHGDYFDFAVFSLAYKHGKLVILGGTEPFYGMNVSYFLQGIKYEDRKYWECHDLKDVNEIINSETLEERIDISDLPKDSHPEKGGSTVFSAGTCSHMMVSAVINYFLHLWDSERPDPPKHVLLNLMTFEVQRWFSSNIDELKLTNLF